MTNALQKVWEIGCGDARHRRRLPALRCEQCTSLRVAACDSDPLAGHFERVASRGSVHLVVHFPHSAGFPYSVALLPGCLHLEADVGRLAPGLRHAAQRKGAHQLALCVSVVRGLVGLGPVQHFRQTALVAETQTVSADVSTVRTNLLRTLLAALRPYSCADRFGVIERWRSVASRGAICARGLYGCADRPCVTRLRDAAIEDSGHRGVSEHDAARFHPVDVMFVLVASLLRLAASREVLHTTMQCVAVSALEGDSLKVGTGALVMNRLHRDVLFLWNDLLWIQQRPHGVFGVR